jgi:hypothetical protein
MLSFDEALTAHRGELDRLEQEVLRRMAAQTELVAQPSEMVTSLLSNNP